MRVSKNIKTMFPGSSLSILQEPSGFPPKCICTCTRTYTHITPSPKPECHHVSTYSTGILEQSLHRFGTRSQVALLVPRRFLLARNFQEENGTSLVARLTGSGGTLSLLGRSATRLQQVLSVLPMTGVDLSDEAAWFQQAEGDLES